LTVRFLEKIRDEQRFDGLEALQAQIHRDAAAARARWAQESAP
jgi:riboflavin kinase/FMN adenylyltransferase